MKQSFKFVVHGRPRGKERARTYYDERTDKMRTVTPTKTRDYEDEIAWAYKQCGGRKLKGAVKVTIYAVFTVPANTRKADQIAMLAGDIPPQKTPDNDNIEKVVFDALNGVAYDDDRQIVENTTVKMYGDADRIVVEVEEI